MFWNVLRSIVTFIYIYITYFNKTLSKPNLKNLNLKFFYNKFFSTFFELVNFTTLTKPYFYYHFFKINLDLKKSKINFFILKKNKYYFKTYAFLIKTWSKSLKIPTTYAVSKTNTPLRYPVFYNKSKFSRFRQICINIVLLGLFLNIFFILELSRSFYNINLNWVYILSTPIVFFLLKNIFNQKK